MDDSGLPDDAPHARVWWVLATVAGLVLVGIGAASADGRDAPPAPAAGLIVTALRPAYQGHYLTPDDVATLRAGGLATTSVRTRELVCQGIELYFDTVAERDAYLAEYGARFPAEPPYLAGDPCRPFRDSPRYVTSQ